MTRPRGSSLDLLDEAGRLVGRSWAWVGVLWLTAMPARFALAFFAVRLYGLGGAAREHGRVILHLAYAALGLWLLSLYGRQVFVRACRRALEGDAPERLGWRGLLVPPGELAAAVSAALAVEVAFWLLSFTVLVPLAMLPAAALAAAASPRAGPGLIAPLRELAAGAGSIGRLFGLMTLMLLGLLLAALNLLVLFQLGAMLLGPLLGTEAAAWETLLSLENPLFVVLLAAGATLAVEPFWLAAITVHVERVRSASSGDDLRQWFAELRAKEAA